MNRKIRIFLGILLIILPISVQACVMTLTKIGMVFLLTRVGFLLPFLLLDFQFLQKLDIDIETVANISFFINVLIFYFIGKLIDKKKTKEKTDLFYKRFVFLLPALYCLFIFFLFILITFFYPAWDCIGGFIMHP